MHRNEDYPRWDNLSEDYYDIAPYNTRLGNSFAIYGSFSYPLYRNAHWEFDACVNLGLAYSTRKYDKQTNADNDMIGSRFYSMQEGGVSATYRVTSSLGIERRYRLALALTVMAVPVNLTVAQIFSDLHSVLSITPIMTFCSSSGMSISHQHSNPIGT